MLLSFYISSDFEEHIRLDQAFAVTDKFDQNLHKVIAISNFDSILTSYQLIRKKCLYNLNICDLIES